MERAGDGNPPLPRPQHDGLGQPSQPDDRIWLLGLVLALFPVPLILGMKSMGCYKTILCCGVVMS